VVTTKLELIREANFSASRRGYDRREVDNFLMSLAEWLERGGHEEVETYAVSRRLERAGETTARVLATAQAEADQIRKEAQAEADKIVQDANRAAAQKMEAAAEQGDRLIEEGERRKASLETAISQLNEHRGRVIVEIQRLREALGGAIGDHNVPPRPEGFDSSAQPPQEGGAAEQGADEQGAEEEAAEGETPPRPMPAPAAGAGPARPTAMTSRVAGAARAAAASRAARAAGLADQRGRERDTEPAR
jgi:DivIVA domain-containing protein